MCDKKEGQRNYSHSIHNNNNNNIDHQGFQEYLFFQPNQHQLDQDQTTMESHSGFDSYMTSGGGAMSGFMVPEVSPILPWTTLSSVHGFNNHPVQFQNNPVRDHHVDPFFLPPPSSPYGGLFNRRGGFAYDGTMPSSDQLRFISDSLGQVVHHGGAAPFGLQSEIQKMTAQEIMDAKALAASKSHSEAERRRRERINNHLAKLRSILPSTTKTDKASLLAEVIQHVKELKRQTSLIAETSPVPTEIDELTVDTACDEDGKFFIKASLCCEDRSDLLPDLIKTLKALNLRTLKAEITTLGGRVKNVLFITSDEDDGDSDDIDGGGDHQQLQYTINSIHEALKAVMEKSNGDDSAGSGSIKRQRTNLNTL